MKAFQSGEKILCSGRNGLVHVSDFLPFQPSLPQLPTISIVGPIASRAGSAPVFCLQVNLFRISNRVYARWLIKAAGCSVIMIEGVSGEVFSYPYRLICAP